MADREALIDLPAEDLKQMILSLLQEKDVDTDSRSNKMPRPRKPDMRSPLETQKDQKSKKSKYNRALNKREKQETQERANQPARDLEAASYDFKNSADYNKLSAYERSLEENRRQREYILQEYRQDGRIDEDEYRRA